MFTGIIQDCASVSGIETKGKGGQLVVRCSAAGFMDGVRMGESIAVNGVCLTVNAAPSGGSAVFDMLEETFSVTTLSGLRPGARVNLEKALCQGDRLGGHMVSGHVDCVGKIKEKGRRGNDTVFTVSFPLRYRPNLIAKGSVAVAGISLTVMELGPDWFKINIIPHTLENTCLRDLRVGDGVNLEFDLVGKYVLNSLTPGNGGNPGMDIDFLRENGFA